MTRRASLEITLAIAAAFLLGAVPAFSGFGKVDGGIEFTYDDPSAGSIHVAGDFNNWNMNAAPLAMDDDGIWRTVIDLAPIFSGRDPSELIVHSMDAHPNERVHREVAEVIWKRGEWTGR